MLFFFFKQKILSLSFSQDPQYMQQALTNALLMDAVVGSLQSSKAIYAASKLAYFDRIKMEGRERCALLWLLTYLRNKTVPVWKLYDSSRLQ